MKIVQFPHEALMKKSLPITEFDRDLEALGIEMLELMHQAQGVGLAANQVGLNKRIFVMQCTTQKPPYIFINPEIVSLEDKVEKCTEGCLSFPGINLEVSRIQALQLKWQDVKGGVHLEKFEGLEAVCIQHENDHLDGINFIDKIGNVKKMMILKKYNKKKC